MFLLCAAVFAIGAMSTPRVEAEEGGQTPPPRPPFGADARNRETSDRPRVEARMEREDIRQDARKEAEDIREDTRKEIRQVRVNASSTSSSTRSQVNALRKDGKEQLEENRRERAEALKENKEELKNKIEERKANLMTQIKAWKTERKDERQKKLDSSAKERVADRISAIFTRLNAQLDRIAKVDTRLAEKINAHATAGHDTSTAASLLVTAQTSLTAAKAAVSAARTTATTEVNASTSKDVLRNIVKTAEVSIETTGAAYKKVVEAIALLPKLSATSSVGTTQPSNI